MNTADHLYVPTVLKLGSLTPPWNPQCLFRPVEGLLYLYLYATVHETIPIIYLPWIYPVENIPQLKWVSIPVSGWGGGALLAGPKQANCRNFIVLQWNSGNLNHAKKGKLH